MRAQASRRHTIVPSPHHRTEGPALISSNTRISHRHQKKTLPVPAGLFPKIRSTFSFTARSHTTGAYAACPRTCCLTRYGSTWEPGLGTPCVVTLEPSSRSGLVYIGPTALHTIHAHHSCSPRHTQPRLGTAYLTLLDSTTNR